MKQTLIDILIYLFENYIEEDIELETDGERLKSELRSAGFEPSQVTKAFDWLQDLAESESSATHNIGENSSSIRVYSAEEQRKIDSECRGFLHFLEQAGILSGCSRELVIDRIFALEADDIDLGQLKWIILMVLLNQSDKNEEFLWMEDLVMDGVYGNLH
jgi:Smg protein